MSQPSSMDYKMYAVLYVDDEPANLTAFTYCFEDEFQVLTCASGEEALKLMEERNVAVLLADQRMPGMSGADLCSKARELYPDTVRIIVSAYSDIAAMMEAINSGQVARYVFKPWRENEVMGVLRSSIETYHLGRLVKTLQVRLLQGQQQAGAHMAFSRLLHEISNPLNTMGGTLDYIAGNMAELQRAMTERPADAMNLAEEIRSASADALKAYEVVQGIIQLFRAGAAERSSKARGIDLCRAVLNAVAIVRSEIRKRGEVFVSTPPDLPPVAIDAVHASQILVNLLINANESLAPEYSTRNRVQVTVDRNETYAVVEVADTGCGIPPEHMDTVFVPFFSTKPSDIDRGLGLAVVKDLVEQARGHIEVKSQVDQGTTFTVRLPFA